MDPVLAFFVIVILLAIHVLWVAFLVDQALPPAGSIDAVADPSTLNTGDLILFRNCVRCHCDGDPLNDAGQKIYRTLFNTLRHYVIGGCYTHVAIVLRGVNPLALDEPYICHIDGGDAMYDAIKQKKVGRRVTVSPIDHVNVRGGTVHVYRRRFPSGGAPPSSGPDLVGYIRDVQGVEYPKGVVLLITKNAFGVGHHDQGTQACTDFVEHTMVRLGIIREASSCATILDILAYTRTADYDPRPFVVVNRCSLAGH